ncbi:mannitol dehydrogenase family protein [Varibaculum massiliense]|uniref:mannitol dehydrogenase family protein n=1 Tax=Varibaculum massiliense TaxID=1852372 RepID=UPI002597983D|nr:mannitol dehydrogenase family protein [Varibaculum massiliense]
MKLNLAGLEEIETNTPEIDVPHFDVAKMQQEGKKRPRWIHIGPGNLFRCYPARVAADLLERGEHWPITAVAPRDPEDMDAQLGKHDLMTLKVTLNPDGTQDLRVVAGISEAVGIRDEDEFTRLVEVARDPSVALMSYTITEKGYVIGDGSGNLQPGVQAAIETDTPGKLEGCQASTMVLSAALLRERFIAGGAPITLLSFDNFSHNGDKLRESVLRIAQGWSQQGTAPTGFLEWLQDESNVAFPITVIDKITPRPNLGIAEKLEKLGFSDMAVETPNRTPLAGFVNTEPVEYLIIEDKFAGERPNWDDLGVQVVKRQVCDDFENMKVTTCLNPLHTALAVAGSLLRMPTIDSEMQDPALRALVNELGFKEGLPVVTDPVVVNPEDFLREVVEVRFPNVYLPDNPARIAMDTSQKIPIRFGETIKKYLQRGMDLETLRAIPFTFALWCRFLMGVGDDGLPFEPAPDPRYEELHKHVADIKLDGSNSAGEIHQALKPILSDTDIFRTDLYATPLAEATEKYFKQLVAGTGAVRSTLDKEFNK